MTKFNNLLLLIKIKSAKNINKSVFISISVILIFLMAIMSQKAGISGDEYFHVDHAADVVNYYKSFGKDTTALYNEKTLHLYGQSLDNEVHIFNELFNIEDIYATRHLFNSMIGWILTLFTGLTAVSLMGWRAGILTLLLMFFSPKLLGHSWNNLKDLPFATAYIFSLYFILNFIKKLPTINYTTLAFIVLGIAWAISLRIGGVILIPYFFLFYGVYCLTKKSFYTKPGFVKSVKYFAIIAGATIFSFFLGQILWPYALTSPIAHPIGALKSMTNYNMGIFQLFEGKILVSKDLPWYYGLKYIFITTPLIVLLGLVLFIISMASSVTQKNNRLAYSFLFFAFAFPIAYTIYKGSNLYGGWRHLLWVYSPLVVLSVAGFNFILNKKNKFFWITAYGLILVLLYHPVRHTFKNHPHQYVYYNQLVGGVNGASGHYEMDYYYHSLKEASDWFIENELTTDSITIASNHTRILEYYFRDYPNVKTVYTTFYKKSSINWDYAIWANTHITPLQLEKGYWPPKKTIHTVMVDNVPVSAVIKRVSYEDLKGFKALKLKDTELAKKHFKAFLKVYPQGSEALNGYARACLLEQNLDTAIIYADSSLIYNPRNYEALLLKASALNFKMEYKKSLDVCEELIALNTTLASAHVQKGIALRYLGNPNGAIAEFQNATLYRKDYYNAFMQLGEVLINLKKYDEAIKKIYIKVLDFKPNDIRAFAAMSQCYLFLNQIDKAKQWISKIPAQNQNNFDVIKTNCRINLVENDMRQAAHWLNITEHISNNSELNVIRTLFFMKVKESDLALKHLNMAIEIDSSNLEAQELLNQLKTPAKKNTHTTPDPQKSIMFQKKSTDKNKKINPLEIK